MASAVVDGAATRSFHDAAAYDMHRPSYPHDAVQILLSRLRLAGAHGAKIIDVTAGTGKFTELLAAREEQYEVLAVEPVARMRQQLADKTLERVRVADGLATQMHVPDAWADAVTAAQSFHWFAREDALREIHRVLKPGGALGIIWNIEDYNKPLSWKASTRWEESLNKLIHSLPPDGPPRFRDDRWWEVFEDQKRAVQPLFAMPIGEQKLPFTVWLDKEGLWKRVCTLSQVSTLEGKDRASFRGIRQNFGGRRLQSEREARSSSTV